MLISSPALTLVAAALAFQVGPSDGSPADTLAPVAQSRVALDARALRPLREQTSGPLARMPLTFRWGFQRPDLLRYNRVEALSVGARVQARPGTAYGPLSVTGIVRLGVADLHANLRVDAVHEDLSHRLVLRAYHELAAIDERARHFGISNSLLALGVGRDDGDYYRRTGGMLEWTPPEALGPRSFRVRGWVERQAAVGKETDFALLRIGDDSWSFRPNLTAEEVWEIGASAELTPRWGTDPTLVQSGLDVLLQAAAGDAGYVKVGSGGHVAVPLLMGVRARVEGSVGSIWGDPPPQRLWYVGGPLTLRGYAPLSSGGTATGWARGELSRMFSIGRFSVFSDVAWAGSRSDVRLEDAFASVGGGLAIVDGLVRMDAAWGVTSPRRFRLDVYLDQIL